jgi:hypothetical protein
MEAIDRQLLAIMSNCEVRGMSATGTVVESVQLVTVEGAPGSAANRR